ncbi:MAG: BON domain-containing protein [Candidatus Riflebacteria bacterium]|nr:BON domain-containing protein [Candidatus Riflebacteria bacterium]
MNKNTLSSRSGFFMLLLFAAVTTGILHSQLQASEKLMIPIGKSVAIPAQGVKKILAVKEGIVDVLNVSDEEIILSGLGTVPGTTQLILWDLTGRRVYDIETYSEADIIMAKFTSIIGNPNIKMIVFPDSVYLKGQVASEEEKKKAEVVAGSLVQDKKIVNLIENEVSTPSLQQRIEAAIKLPKVKVTVISPNYDATNTSSTDSASGSAQIRVVLQGTVEDQNDYIHLTETVRGFVSGEESVSNLVVIENPIQVVFQAYILQVSKNNTKELGIEWGSEQSGVGMLNFIENASNDFRGTTQSLGAPVPNYMNPFYMNNINRFERITAMVRAWETSGKAKVIANPKLLVYANSAMIKIAEAGWTGEKEETEAETAIEKDAGLAYVNVGQKTFFASGIDQSGSPIYDSVEASLKLAIRDMYVNNNELKFSVFAKQEEPSYLRGTDGPPDILNRSIMTTVKIKDQETIVLGGLINRTQGVSWKGVPILSQIPYLGRLFKSKSVTNSENELVILLTPKIANRDTDLAGKSKFETVPVPRRSDRLEKLHNIFQEIKTSHIPVKE